jgi:hypothetical protein
VLEIAYPNLPKKYPSMPVASAQAGDEGDPIAPYVRLILKENVMVRVQQCN